MAGVNPTDYLQFRDMNLPLCLIHYFILLTLARLVWGLHQPSPGVFQDGGPLIFSEYLVARDLTQKNDFIVKNIRIHETAELGCGS